MKSTPANLLDARVLDELAVLDGGGKSGLLRGIIDTFVQDSQVHLSTIEQAVSRGAASDVQDAAHTLKGAALAVGATELARLSEICEVAAHEGALGRVEAGAVADVRDRTIAELERWLSGAVSKTSPARSPS